MLAFSVPMFLRFNARATVGSDADPLLFDTDDIATAIKNYYSSDIDSTTLLLDADDDSRVPE